VSQQAPLPGADELVAEMERAIGEEPASGPTLLAGLVADLTRSNLRQWDLEDVSRAPDATDAIVATAKRAIDELNLSRHGLVQEIDCAIAALLDQPETATMATESPGMVLDRLSVLVIRQYRTAGRARHEASYVDRLTAVNSQLAALSGAFDSYMAELESGRRRFLAYEHLKLYSAGSSTPPVV
jgi:hypothetical protein